MGRHLPCRITECYLPPDTSERTRTPPNPRQKGWYSINLLRTNERLSWNSTVVTDMKEFEATLPLVRMGSIDHVSNLIALGYMIFT